MIILAARLFDFGSEEYRLRRRRLSLEAAARYPQAELRKIACAHYIQRERPWAVIAAVDEVLARAGSAAF